MHLHVIDFLGKMERFLLALFEATVETSHLLILDTSKKKKILWQNLVQMYYKN